MISRLFLIAYAFGAGPVSGARIDESATAARDAYGAGVVAAGSAAAGAAALAAAIVCSNLPAL